MPRTAPVDNHASDPAVNHEHGWAEVTHTLAMDELAAHPVQTAVVLQWLRSTWNDEQDEFASNLPAADDRPGALLAMISGTPVGVLAFKRYQASTQTRPELWINALFIRPDHRRRGLGRRLVQFGMEHSVPRFSERLFVYTEVPSLYKELGWEHLASHPEFGSHTLLYDPASSPNLAAN